jgi:D-arabinose 5-phosphate isomerase GutQ
MMDLLELAKQAMRVEGRVVVESADQLDDSFVAAVELLTGCRGHVIVSGVGTTGMVGRRLAHLLCCVDCPALFLHSADSLHGSSASATPDDVLVLLSKTGETTETCTLGEIAAGRGVPIISLTTRPGSTLSRMAKVALHVSTPDEIDPYGGVMSMGSSLVMAAVCDALVAAVLQTKGTPREHFIRSHPGGIVRHLKQGE